jgi:hypothetical protein
VARLWPASYPDTKKSMTNYIHVHADFYRYFSNIGHTAGSDLIIRKYQNEVDDWDPTRYRRVEAAAPLRGLPSTQVVAVGGTPAGWSRCAQPCQRRAISPCHWRAPAVMIG